MLAAAVFVCLISSGLIWSVSRAFEFCGIHLGLTSQNSLIDHSQVVLSIISSTTFILDNTLIGLYNLTNTRCLSTTAKGNRFDFVVKFIVDFSPDCESFIGPPYLLISRKKEPLQLFKGTDFREPNIMTTRLRRPQDY